MKNIALTIGRKTCIENSRRTKWKRIPKRFKKHQQIPNITNYKNERCFPEAVLTEWMRCEVDERFYCVGLLCDWATKAASLPADDCWKAFFRSTKEIKMVIHLWIILLKNPVFYYLTWVNSIEEKKTFKQKIDGQSLCYFQYCQVEHAPHQRLWHRWHRHPVFPGFPSSSVGRWSAPRSDRCTWLLGSCFAPSDAASARANSSSWGARWCMKHRCGRSPMAIESLVALASGTLQMRSNDSMGWLVVPLM